MSSQALTTNPEAFPLTDKDRQILNLSDEEYRPHTWENLKQLISNNDLHLLTRYPSQLKKYREWTTDIKEKWGTITKFILENRLHWEPSPAEECHQGSLFKVANPIPLTDKTDYKILINDWPYGLENGISHLIIWLKHKLPGTPEKGDLTSEGRILLENFVTSRFRSKLGAENVLWFRNWTGLQSVRTLEHVHVLVRNAPGNMQDFVKQDL